MQQLVTVFQTVDDTAVRLFIPSLASIVISEAGQ